MSKRPEPSAAELEILQILWSQQPNTVRAIHDVIRQKRDVGYTTVLKQIQRMEEKGIVMKTKSDERAHTYKAAYSDQTTRQGVFDNLLNRAFGGSVSGLVTFALGQEKLAPEEIRRLKKLLDEIDEK